MVDVTADTPRSLVGAPMPTTDGPTESDPGFQRGLTVFETPLDEPIKRLMKQQTETEKSKIQQQSNIDIAKEKAEQKAYQSEASQLRGQLGGYDKLMAERPKMNITPDTQQGLNGLAVLMPIAAMLIGAKGQMSGLNAMDAMTGMLKGYQEGNKQRIDFEKQKYDTAMREWENSYKVFQDKLAQSAKIFATDRQAGIQAARVAALEANSKVALAMLDKAGGNPGPLLDSMIRSAEQIRTAKVKADEGLGIGKGEWVYVGEGADRKLVQIYPSQISQLQKDGVTVTPLKSVPVTERKAPEAQEMVRKFTGAEVGAQAPAINLAATTMADALDMADYVSKNKDVIGRGGQFNQLIDRYVTSFRSGDVSTANATESQFGQDEKAQKALRFAKRYAKFLTDYERAVAGGSKGFTVALQQRYNSLLSPEQFSPEGFVQLMKEHSSEVAKGAAQASQKINYNNLLEMGNDIIGRSYPRLSDGSAPSSSTMKAGKYKYNPETDEMEPQ